jgi:hypothetical protein
LVHLLLVHTDEVSVFIIERGSLNERKESLFL